MIMINKTYTNIILKNQLSNKKLPIIYFYKTSNAIDSDKKNTKCINSIAKTYIIIKRRNSSSQYLKCIKAPCIINASMPVKYSFPSHFSNGSTSSSTTWKILSKTTPGQQSRFLFAWPLACSFTRQNYCKNIAFHIIYNQHNKY